MEWPPSQPAGMRRACVPSWGWMCRDAPSFMERVRNRSPSRPAGSECFCLRPSCPAPGPWPLLAQLNSHLLWLLLASSPPCFLHSYYRLPKLLVLSSLNWFSAKPLFVPLLRPLWAVPGASAPPPPAQPRAPPPPLRPAPPLRGGPDLLRVFCLPPVAVPHPAPGSLALVSKVTQRLCRALLLLPASHFLLCLRGGWKRGWGLLERWCGLPPPWSFAFTVGSSLCLLLRPLLPQPVHAPLSLLLCRLLSCFWLILSLLFSLLLFFFFLSIFPFLPVSHFPSLAGFL